MSEPAKKIKQNPESYSPKSKPEILSLVESRNETERELQMHTEPIIVKKAFCLVGAQSAIVFSSDFEPLLEKLRKAVTDNIDSITKLAQPVRMIGFWHVAALPSGEKEYRYFTGVEASCENPPDGLIIKNLPESLYAVFNEQERGQMGGPGGYAYKWLKASVCEANPEIPGDLEVFNNLTDTGPKCEAQIYIPVTAPEGYFPKNKPEILSMIENADSAPETKAETVPASSTIAMAERNTVRIIELPACKMVTSGPINSPDAFAPGGVLTRFCEWFDRFDKGRADRFYPRDFMWSPPGGGFEWGYAVDEIPADTGGFDVTDFPGGLYAVAVSVDADGADHDRIYNGILEWVEKSGCFALDETNERRSLGNITSPPYIKDVMGYAQMDLYFPIKIRG